MKEQFEKGEFQKQKKKTRVLLPKISDAQYRRCFRRFQISLSTKYFSYLFYHDIYFIGLLVINGEGERATKFPRKKARKTNGMTGFCSSDRFRLESLTRYAFVCAIGVGLSVSSPQIPEVVPPSSGFLIGLYCVMIGTGFPRLLFALLGAIPSLLFVTLLAIGCAAAILACSGASVELMVIVYALYVLVTASLFFGHHHQQTSGYSAVMCAVPGVLVVSFAPVLMPERFGIDGDSQEATATTDISTTFELLWADLKDMMIAIGWAMFAVIAGVILPPTRTARSLLTRVGIPKILMGLKNYIQHDEKHPEDTRIRQEIQHSVVAGIHGKSNLTIFEPRICRPRRENLVPPLTDLIREVEFLARYALLKHAKSVTGGESYPPTLELLEECAAALESSDPTNLIALRKKEEEGANNNDNDVEKNNSTNNDNNSTDQSSYLTTLVYLHSKKVRDVTIQWLTDLDSKSGNGLGVGNNCAMTLLQPLIPVKRLILDIPSLLIHPKKWDHKALLWTVEYASGYLILFTLSLYVPSYRVFGIGGSKNDGLYTGWQMISYAFSWTPTVEGTTKRGLSRFSGTLMGGFCAWVGIMVTSLSYSSSSGEDMNPVAVVVWITYFSVFVSYFAMESGPAAMFGVGPNLGAFAKYFGATLSLCVLEVYAKMGTKNEIVVNRIVATLTGVFMAIIVQFIPPHAKGKNPELWQEYLEALRESLSSILHSFMASENDGAESAIGQFEHALKLGKRARFLVKDASAFKALPVFQLDSRIAPLLEDMYVTESLLNSILDVHSRSHETTIALSEKYKGVLGQLHSFLATTSGDASSGLDNGAATTAVAPLQDNLVQASDMQSGIVSAAHLCVRRIHIHGIVLQQIAMGQRGSVTETKDDTDLDSSSDTTVESTALVSSWFASVGWNKVFCGRLAASLIVMIAIVIGVQFIPPAR